MLRWRTRNGLNRSLRAISIRKIVGEDSQLAQFESCYLLSEAAAALKMNTTTTIMITITMMRLMQNHFRLQQATPLCLLHQESLKTLKRPN